MDTTRVLRRERVGVKTYEREGCTFFRIRCDILNRQRLDELDGLVEEALREGRKSIALSVTADSYLYSELIAHMIRLNSIVKSWEGMLYLVEDDAQIRQILDRIGLSRLVRVVPSEDAVLNS